MVHHVFNRFLKKKIEFRTDDMHLKEGGGDIESLKNVPHHGSAIKKILKSTSSKTTLEG